jgi:ABC-type transport system substrate-binding protein
MIGFHPEKCTGREPRPCPGIATIFNSIPWMIICQTLLLLLLVLAWNASAKPVGTVKVAFISNPSMYTRNLVLEPLVVSDRGRIKPVLAEAWQWIDPKTLEMSLRIGVRFHDGSHFDASAVKANFDFFRQWSSIKISKDYFSKVRCEIIGAHKVRFFLVEADSLFLFQLSKIYQIAPAMLKGLEGREYIQGTVPFPGDWGTGPFRVTSGVVDGTAWSDQIVLTAFQGYWNPDYPKVRQIFLYDLFRHFGWPADKATNYGRKAVMDSEGEIDIMPATYLQTLTIARSKYAKIEKIGRFMVLGLINMRKPGSVWRDIRLRRAVNLAINRPFLVEMTKGNIEINAGLIPPEHLGHNPALQPYPYDPQQAKALVRAAGYKESLNIKILLPAKNSKMEAMLGEALAQAGFKAKFVLLESDEFVQKFQLFNLDQPVDQQDWDICITKLVDVTYHPFFDIYQRYFDKKGYIRWIEVDPDLQQLIDLVALEADQDKQDMLLRQCEALVFEKAYIVSLYSLPNTYALNKSVLLPSRLTDERDFLKEIELAPDHWSLGSRSDRR